MSSSSAFGAIPVGADGELLTGVTGTNAVFSAPLSADNSIEFTPGPGTLDFSYSGNVDINTQTVSYQLVLSDRGSLVTINNAGATTLTVPPISTVAFTVGTSILVAQLGAGQITVTPGAGVTLLSFGSLLASNGQYSMLTIVKILTDTWLVSGDLS